MNRNKYLGEDNSIAVKIKKSIDPVSEYMVYLFASLLTTTKYV
ncbi:hypothetical protein [Metabacillus flavus]|nr:hypothetical protein [Metabacillus flavus]